MLTEDARNCRPFLFEIQTKAPYLQSARWPPEHTYQLTPDTPLLHVRVCFPFMCESKHLRKIDAQCSAVLHELLMVTRCEAHKSVWIMRVKELFIFELLKCNFLQGYYQSNGSEVQYGYCYTLFDIYNAITWLSAQFLYFQC